VYTGDDTVYTAKFRNIDTMINFIRVLRPGLSYYAKFHWDDLRSKWHTYATVGVAPHEDKSIEPKELRSLASQAYFTDTRQYMGVLNRWRDCLPYNGISDPLATSRDCVRTVMKLDEESLNDLVDELERIVK